MSKNSAPLSVLRGLLVGILIAGFSFAAVRTADAQCPKLPAVPWWGKASHATIKRYVEKKHGGDWSPYIKKWEKQLVVLKKIYDKDGTAVVTKDKKKLKGPELSDYIKNVEQRVEVIRCLAGESSPNNS